MSSAPRSIDAIVRRVAEQLREVDPEVKKVSLRELEAKGMDRVRRYVKRHRDAGRTVPVETLGVVARRAMREAARGITPCKRTDRFMVRVSGEVYDRWEEKPGHFDVITGLMEILDVNLTSLLLERVAHIYRERDQLPAELRAAWEPVMDDVLAALKALPPIQRQLLWGHYFLDDDLEAVGRRLRLRRPQDAVHQHRWALERLRKPLSQLQARRRIRDEVLGAE